MAPLIAIALLFIGEVLAQVERPGPCPSPLLPPLTHFDRQKVMGQWYEWGRTGNIFEAGQICSRFVYFIDDDGFFRKEFQSIVALNGAAYIWGGYLTPLNDTSTALFKMTFPQHSIIKDTVVSYIAANWDHWFIVGACKIIDGINYQFIFIASKTPTLEQTYISEIDASLQRLNIPLNEIITVDQQHCPY